MTTCLEIYVEFVKNLRQLTEQASSRSNKAITLLFSFLIASVNLPTRAGTDTLSVATDTDLTGSSTLRILRSAGGIPIVVYAGSGP
jgi:hypothetical protein